MWWQVGDALLSLLFVRRAFLVHRLRKKYWCYQAEISASKVGIFLRWEVLGVLTTMATARAAAAAFEVVGHHFAGKPS
jgi:hypothetical protein